MAVSSRVKRQIIRKIYNKLEKRFGDLGWWPASSRFEVIIGAVLTQNTAWKNVERAIAELKRERVMSPGKILRISGTRLSGLIRSAGYYRVKAKRLKSVCSFLEEEGGSGLSKLKRQSTRALREKLLKVNGVGPETADSILVYAMEKPVFVVDAYTKRIFSRHGLVAESASYDEIQSLVHENFPKTVKSLNQFHALLVETGKRYCKKKKALCEECPLCRLL